MIAVTIIIIMSRKNNLSNYDIYIFLISLEEEEWPEALSEMKQNE